MSGPRYKFTGTHFYILREFGADSPPLAITGITNASQAVVAITSHGRSVGDVVYIQDVAGMIEINDRAYIVKEVVDSGHIKLLGANSTNWGTYTSGGTLDYGTWSEMCTGQWSRSGGGKQEIAIEDSCSEEVEYEVGLRDPGNVQMSFYYAPNTSTAQQALDEWDESGDIMAVKFVLPKNGGSVVRLGYVKSTSETAGKGGVWEATADIRLTGKPLKIAA